MTAVIRVRRHPVVQRLRGIRDGREKDKIFIEGAKLAEEFLSSGPHPIEYFFSEKAAGAPAAARLRGLGVRGTLLADDVMAFASDLENPPGLILVAPRPAADWSAIPSENPLAVVLDGLQLPSNVGAVMRTAEAAGAGAVFAGKDGADPFGPKALRASAGSAFRLPVFWGRPTEDWLSELKSRGARPVAAHPRGKVDYTDYDWTGGVALVLGAEGPGLKAGAGLDTVRIPMAPRVESLNVGVTAALLLYEARRRRAATPRRP